MMERTSNNYFQLTLHVFAWSAAKSILLVVLSGLRRLSWGRGKPFFAGKPEQCMRNWIVVLACFMPNQYFPYLTWPVFHLSQLGLS